jgi:4-amino-4-deoxy-L-arabinose transferase-like glycosyltransferase
MLPRTKIVATPGRLLVLIVLLGLVLRIYRFDALSLWLDEGFTVYFSRLPWLSVLGLEGAYDVHPPLYYALVKAVSLGVPEVIAGRLVSVVAGAATVAVLYALVARLLGPWAGVISALVLAVSPLHIWYSQEARQYALVVLLVCLSYLALVEYGRSLRVGWAVLYLVALIVALYTENSAIYAILPQALVLSAIIIRQGRRAMPLIVAVTGVILGFLPWLPQLLRFAGPVSDQAQYVVTPLRVASSLLSVMGLAAPLYGRGEQGGSAAAAAATQAIQMPDSALFYAILLVGAVPSVLCGLAALAITWRATPPTLLTSSTPATAARFAAPSRISTLSRLVTLPMLVMLCLLVGTIATAIVLSLIYPGYVKRTILPAVLGWAMLLGAAPFATRLPPVLRTVGRASVVFCLATSLVVQGLTYANADKQHWRELASNAATAIRQAHASGSPYLLITYPTITDTLIDIYEPDALNESHVQVQDGGSLPSLALSTSGLLPQSVWLAYIEVPGIDVLRTQLRGLGYTRTMHEAYPDTLYLDSYSLGPR